jgi:Putative prokaryotic signal transducing protein
MAEAAEEHENLVKVFDTEEESEAMVVRGLLESAGIDAIIQNREAPQDILPGVGGVVVLVRADQAEDARQTIEAYRNSPTTDADEAVSEEPAEP